MDEFLTSKGWSKVSACGCTPKKYKWTNPTYPDMQFKTVPSRQTWQLLEFGARQIRTGQAQSLESQYQQQFGS